MRHDPIRVADTRGWLSRAASDLRACEMGLRTVPSLLEDSVFHAQQAAEKALKAFLAWHDIPFRRTHDLRELGNQCVAVDDSLVELCERAEDLTPYAWIFRYPGGPESPTHEEADEALSLGSEVYHAILIRLPEEVRP